MLSGKFHEEKHAQFRQKISPLIRSKSEEHFGQNKPQLIPEQAVQTGDFKVEQNKISPAFIEKKSPFMQGHESPSGVSNSRPGYLTCKYQGHLAQTYMIYSKGTTNLMVHQMHCIHTSYQIKWILRMTCDWSCKEQFADNDQRPNPQRSNIILDEHDPSELHVTHKEQKVNIQIDMD